MRCWPRWTRPSFVVSLELRHSEVTERADVVFPVAPTTQKAGAFINWEGRFRSSSPPCAAAPSKPASRIIRYSTRWPTKWACIWGCPRVEAARAEMSALGNWDGNAPAQRRAAASDRAAAARRRRSRVDRLADDARQRPIARRRTVSGRDRAQTRGTVVTPIPRPRSAPRKATRSRSAHRAAQSACRWPSLTCPTGWCGFR